MGLEHLSTVFNDISENLGKPPADKHNQRPPASVDPPHIPEFYQPQREDPISTKSTFLKLNKLIKIDTIDEMQDPSPLMPKDKTIDFKSKIVGPYPNSLVKRTIDPNPTFSNDQEVNTRIKDLSFEFGKNIDLGKGKLVFDTLYKHSHSANTNRIEIDTGRADPNSSTGETVKINTGRAGIINLPNLDIKSHSSRWRTGVLGFLGSEPYVVNNIPDKKNDSMDLIIGVGNNRDLIPFKASLDDVSRLAQFYTSPAGLAFMAKENITAAKLGDPVGKKSLAPSGITFAPPIPFPNTGFLNYLQQSVQGVGLGGSLRKPFTLSYSQKASVGLPFANLGDNLVASKLISKEMVKIENPYLPKFLRNKAKKTKEKIIDTLVERGQIPFIGRPTPFIDLSGGPGSHSDILHGYVDKFNDKTLGDEAKWDDAEIAEAGDFYIKIKDLRDNKFIYFRGYVTGITENVNPSFSSTNYIGRSEPVYLYQRAERDLSFNLRVYPNNQNHFKKMYTKINRLTSLAYPEYLPEKNNESLVRMKAPFTELYMAHIGERSSGQFGFIKSITYTVNESGDWDMQTTLPRLFDIAITYQILNKKSPSLYKDADKEQLTQFYNTQT
tara:strand:+ start:2649 stop:4475 length:1827 start_codon:yes stop_codon:yes gene_type:complete